MLDRFHISGRGDAVAVDPDAGVGAPELGGRIALDGFYRIVTGVENHPVMGGVWTGGLITREVRIRYLGPSEHADYSTFEAAAADKDNWDDLRLGSPPPPKDESDAG